MQRRNWLYLVKEHRVVGGTLGGKDNSEVSHLGDLPPINQIRGPREWLKRNGTKLSFDRAKLDSFPGISINHFYKTGQPSP